MTVVLMGDLQSAEKNEPTSCSADSSHANACLHERPCGFYGSGCSSSCPGKWRYSARAKRNQPRPENQSGDDSNYGGKRSVGACPHPCQRGDDGSPKCDKRPRGIGTVARPQ